SSRRRHTRFSRDWSSDVCSSDLSGHVDGFNDPMIDNKDSKKRYRADQLIEDKIARYEKDGKSDKAVQLQKDLDDAINRDDLARLKSIIEEHNIVCPISGTKRSEERRVGKECRARGSTKQERET